MPDAVLLEWEGVLADTRPARRDALRIALAAEGIAHTLADDDEQLRGLGLARSVRVVLRQIGSADHTLAALIQLRAARAFAGMAASGLVLRPDAVAFVERMQGRARLAIVSRAARAETEQVLGLSGMSDAFTTVVTADEAGDDSPSAAAYELALARLSRTRPVAPARAVAVVDGGTGVRAARAAGVRVLAVRAPVHEAMEADAAVDSLDGVRLDGDLALVGAERGEGAA